MNGFLLFIFDFFRANIALQLGHLKWCNEPLSDFSKSLTALFPCGCMIMRKKRKTRVIMSRNA
jgi:hypothetical protein